MKKYIIIIVSLVVILLVSFGFNIVQYNEVKLLKNDNLTKKEYYQKLEKRMFEYYRIMFRNLKIDEDKKYNSHMITLRQLESAQFPMEDFVSYDGKEKCDTAHSYAIRTAENGKYKIRVYFKCGKDANYDVSKGILG